MFISVQYKDKNGHFSGRPYTYETKLYVRPGDRVIAPTARGDSVAMVAEIGIPESKIEERIRPLIKSITDFAPEESANEQ